MAGKKPVAGCSWDQAQLAPIVLVRSQEPLLADRALARLRQQARQRDLAVEVTRIAAATYRAGQLATYASPSLFQEARLIQIDELELANPALTADLLAYIAAPAADVSLIARHNGGVAGKKLLDAMRKAKVHTVACNEIRSGADKLALVLADVRAARRKIEREAAQALVDALGSDVMELAAATAQLLSDTSGTITRAEVDRYHAGRIEASGFAVADQAIGGNAGQAILLARHCFAAGVHPLQIVAALAMKLRNMAKVSDAPGGRVAGMAPWQAREAKRQLGGWSQEGLARAILAVAQADEDAKGGSRDDQYGLERALARIASCRGVR